MKGPSVSACKKRSWSMMLTLLHKHPVLFCHWFKGSYHADILCFSSCQQIFMKRPKTASSICVWLNAAVWRRRCVRCFKEYKPWGWEFQAGSETRCCFWSFHAIWRQPHSLSVSTTSSQTHMSVIILFCTVRDCDSHHMKPFSHKVVTTLQLTFTTDILQDERFTCQVNQSS